ncbi:MAG TPA: tRNA preQ1(34) S-adenosylmethionine ribosyltransferase-isomerase QueA [Patescibacteria group bacterium]
MSLDPLKYSFILPESQIAASPLEPRDSSRLLVVDRAFNTLSDYHFYDLVDFLSADDVLVVNQSKVFPARLLGQKKSGGAVELLLLRQLSLDTWLSISRPGLKVGRQLTFSDNLSAEVIKSDRATGQIEVRFSLPGNDFLVELDHLGRTPIPPYIKQNLPESLLRSRYQTVYAKEIGSAAAPTAGLHFTPQLLKKLSDKQVSIEYITLHVGLGTFQPLRAENIESKTLHTEIYDISADTASRLNLAKKQGKRIIAVGTTSARTLESAAVKVGDSFEIIPGQKPTNIFIYPPYQFKFVDSLVTNFHLPESSLLMLVSALASAPNTSVEFTDFNNSLIGQAYSHAVNSGYRFYSFGDAMWIK